MKMRSRTARGPEAEILKVQILEVKILAMVLGDWYTWLIFFRENFTVAIMTHVRWTNTPALDPLCHAVAEASLTDARDRSAPSDFHWKVLKCRMMIFSESSIMACPDYRDVKQVNIIFERSAECHSKVLTLFSKFGLEQKGKLQHVSCELFQLCLQYSLTARIAPTWNLLGKGYFVNNRDFLTAVGPQYSLEISIYVTEEKIEFHLKPLKITLLRTHRPEVGDWVRVLPSLNKAIVEEYHEVLPPGTFKSYKDLKRHWKNIHGYRLPESEPTYYSVRFWRGAPLTYPAMCVLDSWPLVVPIPKQDEESTITKFLHHLTTRLRFIMHEPIDFHNTHSARSLPARSQLAETTLSETQAVSLCTPAQHRSSAAAAAAAAAAPFAATTSRGGSRC